MKSAPLVTQLLPRRSSRALLPRAQRSEVLARPGDHVRAQLEHYATHGGAAHAHVEKTSREGRHLASLSLSLPKLVRGIYVVQPAGEKRRTGMEERPSKVLLSEK